MASLQGSFLIASPHLTDPNFLRTVVLIVNHDEEGAFGLILNRPTHNEFKEIWELISETPCRLGDPIHIGGPVGGPLLALHANKSIGEQRVLRGVYLATQQDALQQLVEDEVRPLRFFTGYSGWSAGQLESELEQGGWFVSPASDKEVFSEDQDLWKNTVQQIGRDVIESRVSRPFPDDPMTN